MPRLPCWGHETCSSGTTSTEDSGCQGHHFYSIWFIRGDHFYSIWRPLCEEARSLTADDSGCQGHHFYSIWFIRGVIIEISFYSFFHLFWVVAGWRRLGPASRWTRLDFA